MRESRTSLLDWSRETRKIIALKYGLPDGKAKFPVP